MSSLLHTIRDADYLVWIACNSIALSFSFIAYKRTKHLSFLFWVIASAIAIIADVAWYRYGNGQRHMTDSERQNFQVTWRVVSIPVSILQTAGTVLLIQHILNRGKPEA